MTLTRRELFKAGGVVAGAAALSAATVWAAPSGAASPPASAGDQLSWPADHALPSFAEPTHFDVVDLTSVDADTQTLLTSLQGVVNRRRPRIFVLLAADGTDKTWLDTLGIPYTVHADPLSLLTRYRREISGTVVWDPDLLDTINVATTLAGVHGAVLASPALAGKLAAHPYHLPISVDLRGRFADKLAAYQWVLDALWPRLTHRLLTGIKPTTTIATPGLTWTTLAEVTQHVHDSSNRQTYTIDLSSELGADAVYVKFSDAYTDEGWGPSVQRVTVIADGATICDFQPTTAAEAPYSYDLDGSSADPGGWRYADGTSYFIYKFSPPAGCSTLTLKVQMWNQYLVEATSTAPEQTVPFANFRDYITATGAFVFWLDPEILEEAALFTTILKKIEPNTPYLGWFAEGHETTGVTLCSMHGSVVLAADYLNNASALGGARSAIRTFQPPAKIGQLENKIYVTLVLSEGDNLQYDEHRMRRLWEDPARGKVPLNWTIDPLLVDAAPSMLGYYQKTQSANDLLIAGPSGAGYTYPDELPAAAVNSYTRRTGHYLRRTGINVTYILNRHDDTDLPWLSEPTAKSYLRNINDLIGAFYNWEPSSDVAVAAGTLPIVTLAGCNSLSDMQAAVNAATVNWDRNTPAFLALGVEAWNLGPSDCAAFVSTLNSDVEVVRGDVFLNQVRRSLGLTPRNTESRPATPAPARSSA